MMKGNGSLIALMVFCVITLLSTCTPITDNTGDSINIVKVTAKELLAPVYGEQDTAAKTAAIGANDFAFRLSAELVKNSGDENFVFSPYSVWMPLAALVNATNDENKDAFLTALGAGGITETDINRASSRMLYNMTNLQNKGAADYHNPLQITNAIFVGNDVTLRRDFAQTFMDYYRGSSINVDFSSREAVDAVNRWASESTNGLIKNVIQEFDPTTVAAIANAIYFSDRWDWEFNSNRTKEDVFHAPNRDGTAFYMLREGEQYYYEDDRVQAVPLGFKKNGSMYIILPKTGGATEFLASMTNEFFNEMNFIEARGKLLLPRFSMENDVKGLKEALITLGVPLFDPNTNPLTKVIEEFPVYLSDAIQKAAIKVDEKGTTAAAVTVLPAGGTSAGPSPEPPKPFEMICDKPFVFILCEYTYDGGRQVLFTGVVNQP